MTDHVKYLPPAAIPENGVARWSVADAERWLAARIPALFAPAAGSWVLAVVVVVASVLTFWDAPETVRRGTAWAGYSETVLLFSLPLWFRHLPVPALFSTVVVAAGTLTSLERAAGPAGRLGHALVLAVCAWAFVGVLARLAARRRQRGLALAAAGPGRFPLPDGLPATHRHRGRRWILIGSGLCLAAAGLLVDGLVRDLSARDSTVPYDAVGQQNTALPLLVLGTSLLGHGLAARRAARRLRDGPQPALIVGVRTDPSSRHHWIHADARTPSARPLIAYASWFRPTRGGDRLLRSASAPTLRAEHHDIDAAAEPYEAVLYGVPGDGAEVVLECAVYDGDTRIVSQVTAAPLLPRRRHRLGRWEPADGSHREAVRREEARRERVKAALREEADRARARSAWGVAAVSADPPLPWSQPRRSENSHGCGGSGSGSGGDGDGGCGGCGGCG
ncbi:hypothetical protein ACF06X_11645 [Streptomyces sp. NPDC015346]|uniref:hypothetical protein n=1 Tax=Streptomyces sp. NPDC015346 TaxID=3364954 RepID=UPI0036FF6C01